MNVEISEIANLPTKHGNFLIQSFKQNNKEHLLIKTITNSAIPNVRIHSECLTGDVLGSIKCDCQAQLDFALEYISTHTGIIIYLRQEGRGIGLFNKVNAYSLQDKGLNTIESNEELGFKADERSYEMVDFILNYLSITDINLLTNNPDKINSITTNVQQRIAINIGQTEENKNYLNVKKQEMGHIL